MDASAAWTASRIAAEVRAGADPVDAVRTALARIDAGDDRVGAFATVLREQALAEAQALRSHPGLDSLVLAGVPVAIKDTMPVRGVAPWSDPRRPAEADHPVVERLRAAGAVVVGTTTASDASLWPFTDGRAPDGSHVVTRNPWDPDRTAGGSSGGAAAAVAAGFVPVAQGSDSLGSVRIPASACGLVGVKPGAGVVAPVGVGRTDWSGLAVHGALATTAADAALLLSVMAGRPGLAAVDEPPSGLVVAVSIRPPVLGVRTRRDAIRAVFRLAGTLRRAGSAVERAELRYPLSATTATFARWTGAAADDVDEVPPGYRGDPQPRTLRHAAIGRRLRGRIRRSDLDALREAVEVFFAGRDLLLTPTVATPPPRAAAWSRRPWAANVGESLRFTGGFAGPWNLVGWPAVSVPAGVDAAGLPIGAQLVARPGQESLLLAVAALVERLDPWQRLPPD